MKIYINGYFLNSSINSGVYRFSINILEALDIELLNHDSGFDVILLVPNYIELKIHFKKIKIKKTIGIKNRYFWEQIYIPLKVRGNFLINLANSGPIFKKNQLCVIHDALVFCFPQSYSKKFVYLMRFIYYCLFRYSRYIATVSEFSKNELFKYIKVNRRSDNVIVLGNSAEHMYQLIGDQTILTKYNLLENNYILVVLSQRNSFYKNTKLIAEIADNLLIPIVCVGGVSYIDFQKSKNIVMIGQVTDEALKSLYQNAKFFLMPSLYEGFGIPVLESMVNDCPVVVSDIPVFHEICKDSAMYINPLNYYEATIEINSLIQDVERLNAMTHLSREIIKKYRWKYYAKSIFDIINAENINN